MWLPGRTLRCACLCSAAVLAGCAPDERSDDHYTTIDDLPECDPARPSFDCLQKLFLPLNDTQWPFDRDKVSRAFVPGNYFQVLRGWNLTALHVIDGVMNMQNLTPNCYADAFAYAAPGATIEMPDCGTFLFRGGHTRSTQCGVEHLTLVLCVDQVPVAETFDIGLVAADQTASLLDVSDTVNEGDEVFIVGQPGLLLLVTSEQNAWFTDRYPLVSTGRVLKLDGRGMVISNLAYPGNSGGPVLDRQGRVVGVVYSKIGMLREWNTPTDRSLADHRTIAVRIDSAMKAFVDGQRAAGPEAGPDR
jgi:hypothetical protein